MNKWAKIKEKLCESKVEELNKIFNSKLPRTGIKEWTRQQINKDNCLKLNLNEYTELKQCDGEQELFINSYLKILAAKEQELKLEVVAELIEDKKFPFDVFVKWFLDNKDLPAEQFNEALDGFWGDVWRHAAGGAGTGALAGTAVGALGTGGLGTWAGTGLGALAGGAAGGLYGAGKSLLKKVLQYRKDQNSFEATKQQVLSLINNLSDYAKKFDLGPKFQAAIDAFVEELGATKAYKVNTPANAAVAPQVTPPTAPQQPQQAAAPSTAPSTPPPAKKQVTPPPQATPPTTPPPEAKKENKIQFESPEDAQEFYDQAQHKKVANGDDSDLVRLGYAFMRASSAKGMEFPSIEEINKFINDPEIANLESGHKNEFAKWAGEYITELEGELQAAKNKEEEPESEEEPEVTTGPIEMNVASNMSEKELRGLDVAAFKKVLASNGLNLNPGEPYSPERNNAIDIFLDKLNKKESVSHVSTKHKTKTLSFEEKVDYYKNVLAKRIIG